MGLKWGEEDALFIEARRRSGSVKRPIATGWQQGKPVSADRLWLGLGGLADGKLNLCQQLG